jgi:hypothetical protein
MGVREDGALHGGRSCKQLSLHDIGVMGDQLLPLVFDLDSLDVS